MWKWLTYWNQMYDFVIYLKIRIIMSVLILLLLRVDSIANMTYNIHNNIIYNKTLIVYPLIFHHRLPVRFLKKKKNKFNLDIDIYIMLYEWLNRWKPKLRMLKTYHQDKDSSIGSESFHFCLFLLFFSICSFIGKMRMDRLALTSTFSVCCGKIG